MMTPMITGKLELRQALKEEESKCQSSLPITTPNVSQQNTQRKHEIRNMAAAFGNLLSKKTE